MKRYLALLIIFGLLFSCSVSFAQDLKPETHAKMEWFKDAKLGIFIHWGIYAVNGIDESWSFFNNYISHEDYLKQLDGFTAKKYDPEYWAEIIKFSGAQYSVITTRHHDGFALWDSKFGDLNAVKSSAAKRDVLTPFVKALRNNNLKVGLYYSLPDWSYADYTHHTRDINRYKISDEPKRWNKYLNYYQGQMGELMKKYNPDLWWFDGDWEHNAEEWEADKLRAMLLKHNPETILNSRLRGKGDYETPEQGPPVVRPVAPYWELCLTMNDSWGYQHNDKNYKTPQQVIDIFVDCVSKGGNLLLDIGPKADGTIPKEQVNVLKELGVWTNKHKEAIYGTEKGIPYDHYYGATALSKDKTILYVFVNGNANGQIALKGVTNKINRIWVVGEGTKLRHKVISKVYWSKYPGITYIDLPEQVLDKYCTVLAVLLDGPIDLYRERVGAIESN
ncbi:MAG: alpha-L-fucosidase [Bacteroidetes bacterium]|jgi:alpha-L-fucosidase|nr:alpha-L-fucosidase [Bacteroidota bacterium]MBT3748000.1 alpha-L-fucosidase [Bacteroidota bacterium]MBT4400622.1 alpha-L-fucosidase [Bacteroidota bacterium]MBT4408374.1 alpha-L-fucosidase [Bacteroidota bacterium]MBT5425073.1 alpha-L-fucosidase [Bacteroidota bacterium]